MTLLLLDGSKATTSLQNRVSLQLKRFSTSFGNGRFLYVCLFFLTLVFYVDSQSSLFLWLSGYAALIILVDPKRFALGFMIKKQKRGSDIGEIFGVQAKNTFLAKLYKERVFVNRFDCVEFSYAIGGCKRQFKGMVIDIYHLNEEQWAKILLCDKACDLVITQEDSKDFKENVVYKINACTNSDFLNRFVGVVIEKSDIGKVRFEYGCKIPVVEGDLLEISIGETKILYQIIEGLTDTELLESKNETGIIVGEAIQLGVWNSERRTFEKYGWVPEINSPVLLASYIQPPQINEGEKQIGTIPKTNYPVIMNITEAIHHHIAVLGITGSGKSVFTRDLIRKIIKEGMKIICVDFTGEYVNKFNDLKPALIIPDKSKIDEIEYLIAKKEDDGKAKAVEYKKKIYEKLSIYISAFMDGNESLALFELPDMSNTSFILEFTQMFLDSVFKYVKGNREKKVCIVIEEAHTVVPETSSLGDFGDYGANKALVNKIGQIALQGRKYGVGFIIIAQRTANVSKTVLTQCNSIIAFQQFDKTSTEFLSNYMGSEIVKTLPKLGLYQAIAVGKGFRTGIPMICQVPEIKEPDLEEPSQSKEDFESGPET